MKIVYLNDKEIDIIVGGVKGVAAVGVGILGLQYSQGRGFQQLEFKQNVKRHFNIRRMNRWFSYSDWMV